MEVPPGKNGPTDSNKTAYLVASKEKSRKFFSSNFFCISEPKQLVENLQTLPIRFHDVCQALLDAKYSYYYWQEKIYELVSEFQDPEKIKTAVFEIQHERYEQLCFLIADDTRHRLSVYRLVFSDINQREFIQKMNRDRDTLADAIDRINCIKKTGRICRNYLETMRILGYVRPLHQQNAAACTEWRSSKYMPFPIDLARIIAYHCAR